MGYLRLYKKYLQIQIQSIMQYKASFCLTAVGQFLVSFNVFLGVYFMFQRFHEVEGFTYSQVLLCFAITLMEFSLAEAFARGFDTFSTTISNGEFDRIMVRPRNEIFQVLAGRIELTRIGRMLQAVVMFAYGIAKSHVEWTWDKVLTVVFMLLGGTAVFTGIFLIYAAICFFYHRRAGIYECAYRRGTGIWKISGCHLRKESFTVLYFCCALCADPVLSPLLYIGAGQQRILYVPAAFGRCFSAALLWALEDRGEAL